MKDTPTVENNSNEFFDTLLSIAQQSLNQPQPPYSVCINQSRNLNNIKVDIHVVNTPQPGFFRKLFSKLF
ncbi:MAG TPA: hypothetical protein DEP18_09075 [Flavobacteriales bacterium]|nr:hypothetical protein [Flavobacteriales bacterium]HRE97754.1 hypothetical protein [Flavobacteriales bacterium]HRJ37126.1 hypothetical protein [Flavobacteriales bacterium]HRJ39383.1 hypothetical protein [Flavobacteriales bacterium]